MAEHQDAQAEGEVLNLRDLERRAIRAALKKANGCRSKAAKLLGIGRATLYRRLREDVRRGHGSDWSAGVMGARLIPDEALTREQRRSRRKRDVRARTLSVKRMTKRELELGKLLYPEAIEVRPRTRADCEFLPRPCPFVGCRYHLYVDVSPRTGAIKLNFPDIEPDQLDVSCALDVADQGGTTLEDAGAIMNLTRERIRQVDGKRRLPVLEGHRP